MTRPRSNTPDPNEDATHLGVDLVRRGLRDPADPKVTAARMALDDLVAKHQAATPHPDSTPARWTPFGEHDHLPNNAAVNGAPGAWADQYISHADLSALRDDEARAQRDIAEGRRVDFPGRNTQQEDTVARQWSEWSPAFERDINADQTRWQATPQQNPPAQQRREWTAQANESNRWAQNTATGERHQLPDNDRAERDARSWTPSDDQKQQLADDYHDAGPAERPSANEAELRDKIAAAEAGVPDYPPTPAYTTDPDDDLRVDARNGDFADHVGGDRSDPDPWNSERQPGVAEPGDVTRAAERDDPGEPDYDGPSGFASDPNDDYYGDHGSYEQYRDSVGDANQRDPDYQPPTAAERAAQDAADDRDSEFGEEPGPDAYRTPTPGDVAAAADPDADRPASDYWDGYWDGYGPDTWTKDDEASTKQDEWYASRDAVAERSSTERAERAADTAGAAAAAARARDAANTAAERGSGASRAADTDRDAARDTA